MVFQEDNRRDPDGTYGLREAVCEVIPVEKVARRHTDLEPFGGGGRFTGQRVLPDHVGTDQSLYIVPAGKWRCEECGQGGNVVDLEFLCGGYGSPAEAMMALAVEPGVNLPQERVGNHTTFLNLRTAKAVAEATPGEVPWFVRPWLARGP